MAWSALPHPWVVRAADLTEGIERSLILILVSVAALLTDSLNGFRRA